MAEKSKQPSQTEAKEGKETKKETAEDRVEKKVRSRLSPYEWRLLRERLGIKKKLTAFQREFRRRLATFITGAFAFVAALLWRDAIKSFLEKYQSLIEESLPIKEVWVTEVFTAFVVSAIAIVVIILVTKSLKVNEK